MDAVFCVEGGGGGRVFKIINTPGEGWETQGVSKPTHTAVIVSTS